LFCCYDSINPIGKLFNGSITLSHFSINKLSGNQSKFTNGFNPQSKFFKLFGKFSKYLILFAEQFNSSSFGG